MTDNDRDIPAEETNTQPSKEASKGSCCNPHLSLYISIAALLMAGYALFITTNKHDNSAMQSQLIQLDSKVAGLDDQLSALSHEVQSNRESLVQTKLKKALENIRDIRELAEEGAKATISEVEEMLQNLTELGDQLSTPEVSETPQTNEVIKTLQHDTIADEPGVTPVIDTKTDDANGQDDGISDDTSSKEQNRSSSSESILSELLDAASTGDSETKLQDTKQPTDTGTNTDKPEVNLAPAAVPSGPQAF